MRFVTNFRIDQEKINKLNRVITQEHFHEKIEAIRKINLNFIQPPSISSQYIPSIQTSSRPLLKKLEPEMAIDCLAKQGMDYSRQVLFGGYDESKARFLALEGEAQLTTHVITHVFQEDIIPCCKITQPYFCKIDHRSSQGFS